MASCWNGTITDVLATILFTSGEVLTKPALSNDYSALTSTYLKTGDKVKTLPGGRAQIQLLPNLAIEVTTDSKIQIGHLSITKDGNETGNAMRLRSADIYLARGAVVVWHQRGDEAIASFAIHSAKGEITAKSDALYRVEADDYTTRVTVAAGEVTFLSSVNRGATPVTAGHVSEASATEFTTVRSETDRRGSADALDALKVATELQSLVNGTKGRLPGKIPRSVSKISSARRAFSYGKLLCVASTMADCTARSPGAHPSRRFSR